MPQSLEDDLAARPRGTMSYFFREAFRRMLVSKRTTAVAIGMIAMSLSVVGVFLLISENLTRAIDRWQGTPHVSIYLEPGTTPAIASAIETHLSRNSLFGKRRFVSTEEARERFRKSFANLSPVLNELEQNPFPASFEVEVSETTIRHPGFKAQIARIRALPGVDDVQIDWEWIAKLRRLVRILNLAGLVVGGILAIAAAFTIANVIRLTMVLYKEEIEIMRLVGATEGIIRGPFYLEGVLQGTFGGLAALILLAGLFHTLRHLLVVDNSIAWDFLFQTFLPWSQSAALVAGGTAAGIAGSWLSLREKQESYPVRR